MRILFTQRKLEQFAGTEMVTLDLSRSMKKRGHEVVVYCPRPGRISDLMAANGVVTVSKIHDVPWQPDIIHCHHHLPALTAISAFPETPAIYACHGVRPWVEQPPIHPQIQRYVAVSGKMAAYISSKHGIAESDIRIVPNFIDTERFSAVRQPLNEIPKKAVLFGQRFSQQDVTLLELACESHGIELEKVGPAYGNPRSNPELFLPDYDIAFAIGRSAVEAMACGCAVIPIMPHLAGNIVTAENFDSWKDKNFSPRFFTGADKISESWFAQQLAQYNPESTSLVTEKIRNAFSLEQCVEHFEALYDEVRDRPPRGDVRKALVLQLEKLAKEADETWEEQQRVDIESTGRLALLEYQSSAIRDAQKRVRRHLKEVLLKVGAETIKNRDKNWMAQIDTSGLFDRDWYLRKYPDVAAHGADPLEHYLTRGIYENRDPLPVYKNNAKHAPNANSDGLGLHALEQIVLRSMILALHLQGSR